MGGGHVVLLFGFQNMVTLGEEQGWVELKQQEFVAEATSELEECRAQHCNLLHQVSFISALIFMPV